VGEGCRRQAEREDRGKSGPFHDGKNSCLIDIDQQLVPAASMGFRPKQVFGASA
jgi:hypothetical protein